MREPFTIHEAEKVQNPVTRVLKEASSIPVHASSRLPRGFWKFSLMQTSFCKFK